jgi:hypothetical protein
MMLDKGQITGWDGEPEDESNPAAKPAKADAPGAPAASAMAAPGAAATPANDAARLDAAQTFARKRRGQWLALGLFAFVILLFVLTMTKIGGRIVNWGGAFTPENGAPIE